MVRDTLAWRKRLAEGACCEKTVAEEAIRRAYEAASLRAPEQVLWANGPQEASRLLAFIQKTPRRQRWSAVALAGAGALACPGLLLLIDASLRRGEDILGLGIVAAGFLIFWLIRACLQPLPMPPGVSEANHVGINTALPATICVVLAGCLLIPLETGLPHGLWARGAFLTVTGLAGGLPGVLLLVRLAAIYNAIPAGLLYADGSRPVARQLVQARRRAWSTVSDSVFLQQEALLEIYHEAYRVAFNPWNAVLQAPVDPLGTHRTGFASDIGLVMGARVLGREIFGQPAPGLDGIEDAGRAAAVDVADGAAQAAAFADLAFYVDRLFPFRKVAVAVRPPTRLALDADGRPHSEDGPAIAWADGTEVYAWRGRAVEPDLLDPHIPVRIWRIEREPDPVRRGVLIERYGLGSYLQQAAAREVHRDECGQLYRLEQPRGEPIVAVRVTNATPEADGSFREFWLRVPPTVETAREAVAWTFGLRAAEYDPALQS